MLAPRVRKYIDESYRWKALTLQSVNGHVLLFQTSFKMIRLHGDCYKAKMLLVLSLLDCPIARKR